MSETGAGSEPPAAERVAVSDVPERERYEITVAATPAGYTAYVLRGATIAFVHTEVDPRFEGRGLGGRLIGFALDDARARGLAVLPMCPFVRAFVERHREYVELVPPGLRERFGLVRPQSAPGARPGGFVS